MTIKDRLRFRSVKLTFRRRVVILIAGTVIVGLSLLFTSHMVSHLRQKEQHEVSLWTYALENSWFVNAEDPFFRRVANGNSSIPFVITDGDIKVLFSNLVPPRVLNHPDLLRRQIDRFSRVNRAVELSTLDGSVLYVFYGESQLLKMLTYFPLAQLMVIIIFGAFAYITFRSSKQDEQNRVWIGLAKETAHQLGTPTSSLLGWVEYLRSQPVDQQAVDEMNNDLTRLMKVADRFSKIGSETVLSPVNVNEVVGGCVQYFRSRMPRNVTLEYNGFAMAPVKAMINSALFEWVIENLLKNSLDALQGTGEIKVSITPGKNSVEIDIADTGKGIPKANFKRIFEPGYTTKTRGWGLGLSLSKRIVDTAHKGRIWVVDSEPGKGTLIRISLDRYYD